MHVSVLSSSSFWTKTRLNSLNKKRVTNLRLTLEWITTLITILRPWKVWDKGICYRLYY
jgi:hypothetical protein